MAGGGVKITVKADTGPLSKAIGRLDEKLIPVALKNIGEVLLNSTRKRFDTQSDPTGKPWAPLNPAYRGTEEQRSKKGKARIKGIKKGSKILTASGQLFASLNYQISGTTLTLGTNKIYAAAQQFGATIKPVKGDALVFWLGGRLVHAKKVVLPARPFLGFSPADLKASLEAVEEVAEADWSGSGP